MGRLTQRTAGCGAGLVDHALADAAHELLQRLLLLANLRVVVNSREKEGGVRRPSFCMIASRSSPAQMLLLPPPRAPRRSIVPQRCGPAGAPSAHPACHNLSHPHPQYAALLSAPSCGPRARRCRCRRSSG